MTETVAAAGTGARRSRAPIHLWIVGVLALLWNAMGAFDYLATHLRLDFYMSQFPQEQLDYFYGFPAWAVAGWAFGVWGAFFGSVALLLRSRWAVWLFALSLLGILATTVYSYALSEGAEIMGSTGAIFTAILWIVAIALFLYARRMETKGVLR